MSDTKAASQAGTSITKLQEVMDENFVFAKYFQDSFTALPLPFNCDIWMRKKQPDFYIFYMCKMEHGTKGNIILFLLNFPDLEILVSSVTWMLQKVKTKSVWQYQMVWYQLWHKYRACALILLYWTQCGALFVEVEFMGVVAFLRSSDLVSSVGRNLSGCLKRLPFLPKRPALLYVGKN